MILRAQENLNENFNWEESIDLWSSQKIQLRLIFWSVFHKAQHFLSKKLQSICKMVKTTDIFQKNLGHHLALSFCDLVFNMFSTLILESGQSLKIEIHKISSHFSTLQVSFKSVHIYWGFKCLYFFHGLHSFLPWWRTFNRQGKYFAEVCTVITMVTSVIKTQAT